MNCDKIDKANKEKFINKFITIKEYIFFIHMLLGKMYHEVQI